MSETSTTAIASATIRTVSLDTPIVRGDTTIDSLKIRKPASGELRNLNLADLVQLNVSAICKLLPRISIPTLTPAEVDQLDPADLLAISAEIADFLLQKRQKTESLAA